jgi:hypothetical protein
VAMDSISIIENESPKSSSCIGRCVEYSGEGGGVLEGGVRACWTG